MLKNVAGDVAVFRHCLVTVNVLKSTLTARKTGKMAEKLLKTSLLLPPSIVRGMKKLDTSLFAKTIQIPCLKVKEGSIGPLAKKVKPFMLKMEHLKPVQDISEQEPGYKIVLLNPDIVTSFDDFQSDVQEVLNGCGVGAESFESKAVDLTYANWKCEAVLGAVLPEDGDKTTGYSRIGHIVHLNLREHLVDYRFLIGRVLLDKLKGVTCVVNKTEIIDNTYRNFNMEVIAGENDMIAKVRENGCSYEFDFSHVFWNPRLCSEHERLVSKLRQESVLYDVFAGVGPFAIPAARKKCRVLANDLNGHSYKWLQHNIKLNKVADTVTAFNLDGRQFIRETMKQDVVSRWNDHRTKVGDRLHTWPEIHVVMNLPALAVEFLDTFRGWLSEHRTIGEHADFKCPMIHCYMFCKDENFTEPCIRKVESVLDASLDRHATEAFHVRSVAPNKEMIRVSFALPKNVIFHQNDAEDDSSRPAIARVKPELNEPGSKRLCA